MPRTKRTLVKSGSPYESTVGFSRAVRVGAIVAVAGTAPIGPDGKTVDGDAAAQARRCLTIAREALAEAGANIEDVIRTRTYLTHVEDWQAVAAVHGEFFGDVRPASTMLQIQGLLDPDWRVEIEVDAVVPGTQAG